MSVLIDRQLEEGSARQLISKFDVKQREYYGNTSMDAEISLLMANQTLVRNPSVHYFCVFLIKKCWSLGGFWEADI